ncbi:hypothetical protein ACSBR2_017285 [Camellia fascicularis]
MAIEISLGDMLVKVVVFMVVQALVYIILSRSSNIFSKSEMGSPRFKRARSVSFRRFLAALADMPPGGEPSPSSKNRNSPIGLEYTNSPRS